MTTSSRRRRGRGDDTPWYENWWAGVDLEAVREGDTSDQKSKSRTDRDASRRWAENQRPRGGLLRRLLG